MECHGRRGFVRALCAGLFLAASLPFAALAGRRALLRRSLRLCTQAGHLWAHLGHDVEEYAAQGAVEGAEG
jgi:hypothetical protein